jgi:hypothetical protein
MAEQAEVPAWAVAVGAHWKLGTLMGADTAVMVHHSTLTEHLQLLVVAETGAA